MNNPYCEILGIKVPVLEELIDHRRANTYSLMIVTLLERGGPMTLAEAAERFAEAGIAPVEWALRSLKRCRPARAPSTYFTNAHPGSSTPSTPTMRSWTDGLFASGCVRRRCRVRRSCLREWRLRLLPFRDQKRP